MMCLCFETILPYRHVADSTGCLLYRKKTKSKGLVFLAVANHYDAHVFFVFNEIWRVIIQTMNSLFRI